MTEFSANLGFLWLELPLPEAIRAAHRAGFDAVECHWPYEVDHTQIRNALQETGLAMLNINTVRGNVGAGEFGTAALAGRETETREAIDQAIEYAGKIGSPDVHVLPGIAEGSKAKDTFLSNLDYACQKAAEHGITVLVEPVNTQDIPGYFLNRTTQAEELIEHLGAKNLKLMFDCYHVQIMEVDVIGRLEAVWPQVRHVQFSSVPGRGRPDQGNLDYGKVFRRLSELGHTRPLGAEYNPNGLTEASLDWMSRFREAK